jgi:hypothetical protein
LQDKQSHIFHRKYPYLRMHIRNVEWAVEEAGGKDCGVRRLERREKNRSQQNQPDAEWVTTTDSEMNVC